MRIHLLVNTSRPDAVQAASEATSWLRERLIDVGAEHDVAEHIGAEPIASDRVAEADLVVSFGGDGTLIRAAHLCSLKGTPILGVYFGRFGFVTQCAPQELGAALSDFFDGKARIEERMMVEAKLIRGSATVAELHSLNEMSVLRETTARMLTFRVSVDGQQLTAYPADGVLVATPTGSTAYNLSAGGPIIDPSIHAMVLTAVTPHTLSARPLVLSSKSTIELSLEEGGEAVLSSDGQSRLHLLTGDRVRLTASKRVTRLVTVEKYDFLLKLADRLLWSRYAMKGDDK